MAERRVRRSGKDSKETSHLFVIRGTRGSVHTYCVDEPGFKSNARVYSSPTGKHLKNRR